ncbi:hypothetical protein DRQ36_03060, partial [bacterium]
FSDGLSKIAVSFGVGFVYQTENWRLSLAGDDLNMPNIALDEDATDRLPLQIQAGGEFTLPWENIRIFPLISYRNEYGEFGSDIDPTLTARKSFLERQMDIDVSVGRWAVGMGISYFLGDECGPGFGYEISMPTTGVAVPSHRLSASYRFNPPPPSYPDLTVGNVSVTGTPVIGGNITISAVIQNEGIRKAGGVPVNFRSKEKNLDIVNISSVPAEGASVAELEWSPDSAGVYIVHIRADDAGGRYPDYNSKVLELDETNNAGICTVFVFDKPKPSIKCEPPGLMVTQLITVTQDEPVVPIVFFEAGESEVPERFDRLLKLIGERLENNSDATIMVEGYFGSDDSIADFAAGSLLAFRRAESVARKIVEEFPRLNERVRISDDHDPTRPRAEKEDFEGTRLGKIYTAQENRRAELRIYSTPPREWKLDGRELSEKDIKTIRKHLTDNPLFEVVAVAPTLDSAFALSAETAELLGSRYKDRVYSREAPGEEPKIVITAGGILYQPRAFEVPESELRVEPGFGVTKFTCSIEGGAPARHSYLQVRDDRGEQIWHTENPEGFIHSAKWDWTDKNGRMVDPDRLYFADLTVKDVYDQIGRSEQETLRVVRANRRDISERLILVQFTFAGTYGEPDYASVRMEHLARKVVNRIAQDGSLRVVIGGHTDIVGVESGNIKLSNRRAQENMKNLRKYMMEILSFDEEKQLDDWLASHNSVMSARGYGPSVPYVITRGKGESAQQILIGDNELPEGRITNRRVEIYFAPLR